MINLIKNILSDLERDGLQGKADYWRGELEELMETENINKVCTVGDIRRGLDIYEDGQHVTFFVGYDGEENFIEVADVRVLDVDLEDKTSPCIHIELD